MDFKTCGEAYEAGYAHIKNTDPNYARHLDRDGDGIACDQPPAGFVAATGTAAVPADQLPVTGAGAAELGGAAAALFVAGVVAVVLVRRRRVRFMA